MLDPDLLDVHVGSLKGQTFRRAAAGQHKLTGVVVHALLQTQVADLQKTRDDSGSLLSPYPEAAASWSTNVNPSTPIISSDLIQVWPICWISGLWTRLLSSWYSFLCDLVLTLLQVLINPLTLLKVSTLFSVKSSTCRSTWRIRATSLSLPWCSSWTDIWAWTILSWAARWRWLSAQRGKLASLWSVTGRRRPVLSRRRFPAAAVYPDWSVYPEKKHLPLHLCG